MFVYFFAMGAAMFVYIFAMTAAILNYETLKIAQLQKKHICVFSRESWIYGYFAPVYPPPPSQDLLSQRLVLGGIVGFW